MLKEVHLHQVLMLHIILEAVEQKVIQVKPTREVVDQVIMVMVDQV